jgi:hypothetical protein
MNYFDWFLIILSFLTLIRYGKAWPPKKKMHKSFLRKSKNTIWKTPLEYHLHNAMNIFRRSHPYVRSYVHFNTRNKKIVKSNFGFVLWAAHLRCCKVRWKNKHFCFAQNSCMIPGGVWGPKGRTFHLKNP